MQQTEFERIEDLLFRRFITQGTSMDIDIGLEIEGRKVVMHAIYLGTERYEYNRQVKDFPYSKIKGQFALVKVKLNEGYQQAVVDLTDSRTLLDRQVHNIKKAWYKPTDKHLVELWQYYINVEKDSQERHKTAYEKQELKRESLT